MGERSILKISLAIGLSLLPILFRKPSLKIWSTIYIINGVFSHIVDRMLVETKRLKYPVRLLPHIFKIHIVYDYFICPLLTVMYCQCSQNSRLMGIIGKGLLFAIPQVLFELQAERKTRLIKYQNGWTWIHSYIGIAFTKLLFRWIFERIKKNNNGRLHQAQE